MKKKSLITMIVFCLSLFISTMVHAEYKKDTNLGKKVEWINISANEMYILNGTAVTFMSKNPKANLLTEGLDKRIKYMATDVRNASEKRKPGHFLQETKFTRTSSHVRFDKKETTKKVTALIIFYDANKKPIAYQEKPLTVKKLVVPFNKSIKKVTNNKHIVLDKKQKGYVAIDVAKEKGVYWSLHSSLKPLSVSDALKQEQNLDKYPSMNTNPWYSLPLTDLDKPRKGTLYTMIVIYDKNFKPIKYINQTFNSTSFQN